VTARPLPLVGLVLAAALASLPASAPAAAATKPRHDLTVSAKEIGDDSSNRFKMFGSVPTYRGKDLKIERKVNNGPFEPWSTDTTSADKGRFSFRIYGGKVGSTICYRVVVPATKHHRRTKGRASCIETKPA
jgi:predicted amidohydrolase